MGSFEGPRCAGGEPEQFAVRVRGVSGDLLWKQESHAEACQNDRTNGRLHLLPPRKERTGFPPQIARAPVARRPGMVDRRAWLAQRRWIGEARVAAALALDAVGLLGGE